MKKITLTLGLLVFACMAYGQQKFIPTVLVEFYTSEGCSSCPLADEFGQEIRAIADSNKLYVFTLDYHVDLWDKSGWVDPFSDSMYTQRQLNMALANGQKAMFTPMVFVNGKGALPAGAKNETGKLIEGFTRKPAEQYLLFSASWLPAEKSLMIEYEVKGATDSCDIFFALAQNEAYSVPAAGENMGKKLSHHNVVRKLVSSDKVTAAGSVMMGFVNTNVDFNQFKLVGFLQHKRTGQILASQVLNFKP